MTAPNHIVQDARRAATLASIVPSDIPTYDRVTEDIDSAGNRTLTYWDYRYTAPVHVQWVPAPPVLNDINREIGL